MAKKVKFIYPTYPDGKGRTLISCRIRGVYFGCVQRIRGKWDVCIFDNDLYPQELISVHDVGMLGGIKILRDFACQYIGHMRRHLKELAVIKTNARRLVNETMERVDKMPQREYRPRKIIKTTPPDAWKKRMQKLDELAF